METRSNYSERFPIVNLAPRIEMVKFGGTKTLDVKGEKRELKGEGRLESRLADRLAQDTTLKQKGIITDLKDPRLQNFLKDRKKISRLMKDADREIPGFDVPAKIPVKLDWGEDWQAFLIKEGGCKSLHLVNQVWGSEPTRNEVIVEKGVQGWNSVSIVGKPRGVLGEEQEIAARYNPATGEIKEASITEFYSHYPGIN